MRKIITSLLLLTAVSLVLVISVGCPEPPITTISVPFDITLTNLANGLTLGEVNYFYYATYKRGGSDATPVVEGTFIITDTGSANHTFSVPGFTQGEWKVKISARAGTLETYSESSPACNNYSNIYVINPVEWKTLVPNGYTLILDGAHSSIVVVMN